MKIIAAVLCASFLLTLPSTAATRASSAAHWPALAAQLQADRVQAGSALERLIRANQDFSRLRPEEAHDLIGVPLWLRVQWRKAHPEGNYNGADPTGGYPRVLHEIHTWMIHHQDLRPSTVMAPATQPGAAERSATVGGNVNISGSQSAPRSESDIRINPWNPMKVVAASNDIELPGQQAQYWSTDGGVTWGRTQLTPGVPPRAFDSDPTVDWSSDGTAWSTSIGILDAVGLALVMYNYKSTDGGATWTFDAPFSGTGTGNDKQMIWVDHSATSPYKDRLYCIWHDGNPAVFNYRTPGAGGVWLTNPIQISSSETTGTAIGGDVKTNSAGDVFTFWPDTGSRGIYVAKSTNGGASFGAPVLAATAVASYDIGVPSMNSRRVLIYVYGGAYKTATKDLVYATWDDLSGEAGCSSDGNEPGSNVNSTCKTRTWFVRSTDGGSTWQTPRMVNNQASKNDQLNHGFAVDETSGALAIIYYDTVADSGRKKTDIWFQSSFDDGVTWSAAKKVTTAKTDETGGGADSGNQYGDYNSLSGYAAKFLPSWTDRRGGANEEIWTAGIIDIPNRPPVAAVSASPLTGNVGLTVNFNGSASSDPDSGDSIASYSFNFGDGSPVATQAGATISHTYNAPGSFNPSLTVTDSQGLASASATPGTITIAPGFDFFTATPCRIYDSRTDGGALGSAQARTIPIASECGIAAGAKAVALTVTLITPSDQASLELYPEAGAPPTTNTVSAGAGLTRAGNIVLGLAADGSLQVYALVNGGGTAHFALDATGWFQ